jgi:uncharacterized protein (DUF2249 family)
MTLDRQYNWNLPFTLKTIEDCLQYIKDHYAEHQEESAMRITDFNIFHETMGPFTVKQNSDTITISHDGTHASIVTAAGSLHLGGTSVNYVSIGHAGTITFVGTAGLQCGNIWAEGVAVDLTSALQNDWDQILAFDTNGISRGMTSDHANDHILVASSGDYLVSYNWSGHCQFSHEWDVELGKNNGATKFENISGHVTTATAGRIMSLSCSGIVALDATDTLELWIKRTSAGNDIVLTTDNCAVTATMIGG